MRNGKEAKARRKEVMCDPLRGYEDAFPSPAFFPGDSPYFPTSVASANECTGIAPTLPLNEAEAASLRDLYAVPVTESKVGKTREKGKEEKSPSENEKPVEK